MAFLAAVLFVPFATTNLTGAHLGAASLFWNDPDSAKFVALVALVGLAFGAWALSQALSNAPTVRWTWVAWLVVGFVVWIGVASAFAVDPRVAYFGDYRRWEGAVTWVAYSLALFLGLQLVGFAERRRVLSAVLVISATAGAVWGLAQVMGVDPTIWGPLRFEAHRAFGTFGNPDLFAGSLLFALPVGLALAVTERGTWRKLAWWVCTAAICVALLTSFVRGAWAGAAIALAILALALWRTGVRPGRLDSAMLTAVALAVLGAGIATLRTSNSVTNAGARIASSVDVGSGSVKTRLLIWQVALAEIASRPLFGWGADSFAFGFGALRTTAFTQTAGALEIADAAHDLPLHVAATLGIPGALGVLSAICAALGRAWRTSFAPAEDADPMLAALWAGAAGYIVHLLFGVSVVGSTALLWIVLGALLVPDARSVDLSALGRPARIALGSLGVVLALAALGFAGATATAETIAQRSLHNPDAETRVALAEQAERIAPWVDEYRSRVGIAHAEAMRDTIESTLQIQAAGGAVAPGVAAAKAHAAAAEVALSAYARSRRYDPDAWGTLIGLQLQVAEAFSDRVAYQRAADTAEAALLALPEDPIVLVRLGQARLGLGDAAGAADAARRALARDTGYADASGLLAAAQEKGAK